MVFNQLTVSALSNKPPFCWTYYIYRCLLKVRARSTIAVAVECTGRHKQAHSHGRPHTTHARLHTHARQHFSWLLHLRKRIALMLACL